MAIYHFSAKVISRANGSSAVAAASYRSASRLPDERLGRHHDFTNKAGVVHSEVMLPEGAPASLKDRSTLWNAVEANEKRKDAQLAREIEFAIPREMSEAEGIRLARDFVAETFVSKGMVADLNVHWDKAADGSPKPHAHVMLTMRACGADGFGPKVRNWNDTALLKDWREAWATHANTRMAELGIAQQIDHRSFETQGIELEPQHKIGAAGSRRERAGENAERAADHVRVARENGERIIADPRIALDAITRQQATFTVRDLATFVHRHSHDTAQFDRVLSAVRTSSELVQLGRDGRGDTRYTSREMLDVEARLERSGEGLAAARGHHVSREDRQGAIERAEGRGLRLSDEQRDAVRHVTGSRDLAAVVGYAGSGKSAMLGVARDAWEAAGYTVKGAALSGIAAENLEGGSGITSRTLASYEHQWAKGRDTLTSKDVLVIDEAGMVGTRQMERVLSAAHDAGAKVVMVGDAEQLQAIEAGAAFRSITQRHGAAEISEVRRQREDWQRNATRAMATGRMPEAIAGYREHGMVHAAETRDEARTALVDRWDSERQARPGESRIILTHTRDEVAKLNAAGRGKLRESGELGTDVDVATEQGSRSFAVGDRVMFLRNERGMEVKNGSLGTVSGVSADDMSVRLDGGREVAFSLKDYADIDHGYAATIHKSQGVTVDCAHVLASPGLDRHAAYVALSRHRDSVHLHYGRDDFAEPGRLVRTLSRDRPKDMAMDYLSTEAFEERRDVVSRSTTNGPVSKGQAKQGAIGERDRATPALQAFTQAVEAMRTAKVSSQRTRKPGVFAGMRFARSDARGKQPASAAGGTRQHLLLAADRYAEAYRDIARMGEAQLPVLPHQAIALVEAGKGLEEARPGSLRDVNLALRRDVAAMKTLSAGGRANGQRLLDILDAERTRPHDAERRQAPDLDRKGPDRGDRDRGRSR